MKKRPAIKSFFLLPHLPTWRAKSKPIKARISISPPTSNG
jgi:hypothetical protein